MSSSMLRFRLLGFVAGFAVVTFLLSPTVQVALFAQEKGILDSILKPGNKEVGAIDFELNDLKGEPVRLSKYRGDRHVLLYFWATWCPYCLAVKPDLMKIRERITAKEMEILAINVGGGDSIERLKKYQEGHPVSWPVLYDGNGGVTRAYQVQGIPLFVLVDKEGNIVFKDNMLPQDITKYMK